MRAMKAQMIFEFIVAAVLFIGIVFYIINVLNISVASFGTDFYSNSLQSKVVQVSEHLVYDLSSEWPVLDRTKLDSLQNDCVDYENFLKKLDLEEKSYGESYNINIQINEDGGGEWSCTPPGVSYVPNITRAGIKRFGVSDDDDIITLEFWLW
jgi:hypothetical protein